MTRVTDKISKTEEAKKSLLYSAHTVYNTCTKAGHKRGFIFMGKQKTKSEGYNNNKSCMFAITFGL